jgi:hypothetical protein
MYSLNLVVYAFCCRDREFFCHTIVTTRQDLRLRDTLQPRKIALYVDSGGAFRVWLLVVCPIRIAEEANVLEDLGLSKRRPV